MSEAGSSVPRRQLGRYLRSYREAAGIEMKAATTALEIGRARMYRIEAGQAPVRRIEVQAMCELYGVTPELTEVFVALAAETKARGWWQAYGDSVPEWFELFVGLEAAASKLRRFEPQVIPGILQTRAYAEEAIGCDPRLDAAAVRQRVELRLERQKLLHRRIPGPPELEVLLDESVLHRPITNNDEWCRQLAYLVNVSQQKQVSVRVIPKGTGLHRATIAGAFVILDFPVSGNRTPEPTTVYMEGITGALYLDRPSEVETFESVWSELSALALDRDGTDDLISAIIRDSVD